MPDEKPAETLRIGHFFFEYDESNKQLLVGQGEEVGAMMEHVQPEDWIEFVEKARNGDVDGEAE